MLTAAVIQLSADWLRGEERLLGLSGLLAQAAEQNATIAVLPEVSLTGYDVSPHNYQVAEPVPGPLTEWLSSEARRLAMVVIAGMVEREGRDLYNIFAVADSTGWRGHYRKNHISTVENSCWKAGHEPGIIETEIGRIGLGICADMVYRTPWDCYLRERVDLVAVCAAWPDFRKLRGLPVSQRFREIHYGCTRRLPEKISKALGTPVLFSNYCGAGPVSRPILGGFIDCSFAGGSRIVTRGQTVTEADSEKTDILYAEIETGGTEPDLQAWQGPWLPDAGFFTRCQFYGGEVLSRFAFTGAYQYRKWKYTKG